MLSLMPLPLLVENVLTIGKIFFPGFLVVFDQLFGGVWVTIVFCFILLLGILLHNFLKISDHGFYLFAVPTTARVMHHPVHANAKMNLLGMIVH